MDRSPIVLAVMCALLAGCAAAPSAPQLERKRWAFSGTERRISYSYDISADCQSNGEVKFGTVTPPSHGSVRFEPSTAGVGSNSTMTPDCIGRTVPVTGIHYRSVPGFVGQDRMVLEIKSPTEAPKLVTYLVDVKAPPQAAFRVDPVYPPQARRRGLEGSVTVHLKVESDGSVSKVTIIKSPDELFSAATVAALSQWRFNPEAGAFVGEYVVIYRLTDPATPKQTPNLR